MILQLNENNLVIAYATTGGLGGNIIKLEPHHISIDEETGEEIQTPTGLIPEDFESNFRPLFYKFNGEKVVENEDFEEPEELELPVEPNPLESLQQENLELKLALAEMAESQEKEKLATKLAIAELAELITKGVDNIG